MKKIIKELLDWRKRSTEAYKRLTVRKKIEVNVLMIIGCSIIGYSIRVSGLLPNSTGGYVAAGVIIGVAAGIWGLASIRIVERK